MPRADLVLMFNSVDNSVVVLIDLIHDVYAKLRLLKRVTQRDVRCSVRTFS